MTLWDGTKNPDGPVYYRGSVRMIFARETVTFFGEASWGQKLARGVGYGMDRAQGPQKWTRGRLENSGLKVKGFAGGVQKIKELLAEQSESGSDYGNSPIDIVFQFIEANESPIDVHFYVCLLDEDNCSISDSPDPIYNELMFWFKRKTENGLSQEDRSEEL